MEENTQLPKEVVEQISEKAHELAMNNTDLGYLPSDRIIQSIENRVKTLATAYASKLHQANETIKDLERWKAEAICLLSKIDDYAHGHPEIKLGMGKVEFTIERAMKYDESAAGKESDAEDDWIDVNEKLPEEGGRYWCYVESLTDLGFSYFQWNCDYNDQLHRFSDMTLKNGERVTHWRKLPEPPKRKQQKEK